MAVRFPKEQPLVDLTDSGMEYFTDHLTAVSIRVADSGELCHPCGIAIDPNTDQIYVVRPIPPRVSIFSEMGDYLNTFSNVYMRNIWGIAVNKDNVYVRDICENVVFNFKRTADSYHLVGRIGGRGSGFGQFRMPKQLYVSTDGDVFVTDCYNHRIQILDGELRYQRQISHDSMREPLDVKLTSDTVFVLSNFSPCIHVFTATGVKLRSFITSGVIGMKVTNKPQFFCIDSNENLIISDTCGHQIKIFSKEGTLRQTLGKPGRTAGMFEFPKGIALTNTLKLVVASWTSNYCLQIFSCTYD